jgi:hypothetical protein
MYCSSFRFLLILFFVPFTLYAQDTTSTVQSEPLIVRTVGVLDENRTALYSLLVYSGDQPLTDLTIVSTIPEWTTFMEAFWTPEKAEFIGQKNGVVTWTLPELPAKTILGPFTYRVKAVDFHSLPINVVATVSSAEVMAQAPLLSPLSFPKPDQLAAWKTSGTLTVEPTGTDGLKPVSDTGVLLDIPAGTVSETTILTVTRLPLEDSGLPSDLYWWCTLVQIEAEPMISFNQPVTLAIVTRRTLTPGMPAFLFTQDTNHWMGITATQPLENEELGGLGAAFINSSGEYVVLPQTLLLAKLSERPLILAAGVNTSTRQIATISTTTLNNRWIDPDTDPLVPVDRWINPDTDPSN